MIDRPSLVDCGGGVWLERAVRCTLSDGVALVSDHYYPPGDGPHPTILMRQPYGRDIASTVVYAHPIWFASHGYNVVIQDVRGRGDSEGEFYPFRTEGRDGAETIAWLRTRPESNGKVGMYGFSYQGLTQLLAAAERPRGLLCISPAMAACDLYRGWFYHHGALRLAGAIGWGLQMLRFDARRAGLREAHDEFEAAWASRTRPLAAPYENIPAIQATYLQDWITHTEPGEYWSAHDVSATLDRIDIPALHVSGWYDMYLQGSFDGFLSLCEHAGSQFARDHQYLLAGPWLHIPWGSRIGERDFGPDARLDTDALLLAWFNHWLKDSGEFAAQPRIRHFALGAATESRWFSTDELAPTQFLTFYLHSQGRANSSKGDGALGIAAPTTDEPADQFVYDPEVPVLAPGGSFAPSGCFDQAVLEQGNNLLVYTTAVFEEPIHVFGSPTLELFCITSAVNADFTGKLVRVTPDGRCEFLCIGIARSGFLFKDEGYASDSIYRWRFTLEPTSCVFAAGDRLRIEIAGGAFPLYDRNPSRDIPARMADPWNWARSTHRVLHDAAHPSTLTLPLALPS
ncbi:hypothetical protein SAMN05421770_11088 [Granulicella rosea]|uniref:Xaa-Pro dipeptidyl-peptidase C-terminal domain-containing protein n=1 Tax=Granulicella rosea TaxID=474952 RepID=A0A239M811_9BACT|nr:CocE/NonD family hydrolase [Granulicella rosea]SNT38895.1 hypothetical protein SAMN05421770_11088 [Granulicella rosea]